MSITNQKTTSDWVIAYASVIGNGHLQLDLPCQDSCVHQRFNEIWGIAVVADGAGSASHSDLGSDFVARNTAHCFSEVLARCEWASEAALPSAAAWRKEALQALQLVRQRLEQISNAKEHTLSDLACTVLVVLYSPFGLLTAHIGDGRAAYSTEVEQWKALIEPFRGNEVNETVFITSNI